MSARSEISDAMEAGDLALLARLHGEGGALFQIKPVFAGGSWLHFAASYSSPEVLNYLVGLGFSVNEMAAYNGDRPLMAAAGYGRPENVRYLLDHGSEMDTSKSVRNPLFGAIIGKSLEVVRLLLERGIDATVRYRSDTMTDMDATAFALFRGEKEIARVIAIHNAGGDPTKAKLLLEDAQKIADAHGPMKPVRLVPTDEDLEDR
jgi:uncharacterized protein